ncbi:E3 ubiquitin-protein ligase NHLRC1-like [Dromiciops gliroides]|uniref:E3 ubiquitin-protein ligase NHLRC1-like n=1 Tax=Dromiciops gliroides TaxID=33562 RepID=UPI001CC66AFE|nr:E3 ubiquitin-protein ligase NHLRC1-like [Dromiciops gliroides]
MDEDITCEPGIGALVREAEVSLLECKVCFEKYSHERERRPRNLACGHVICLGCVMTLVHPLTHTVECPFCRTVSSESSDCFLLLQFLELLSPALNTPQAGARPEGSPEVKWFPGSLTCIHTFGGWGNLINPTSMAFCQKTRSVVVVHDGKNRVKIFGPDGVCANEFGEKGDSVCHIRYPLGVTITQDGYLVVTDAGDRSLKVFDFAGESRMAIRGIFSLPWGVQITPKNEVLVSDAEAGSLHILGIDFQELKLNKVDKIQTNLSSPRAVAVSPVTGNIAVAEHLKPEGSRPAGTRVKVFSPTMQLLGQVDSFGLSLFVPSKLDISAITFDYQGNIIVADATNQTVACLGKPERFPVYRPIITQGLSFPVSLIYTEDNSFLVLDSGIHAVKIYTLDYTL